MTTSGVRYFDLIVVLGFVAFFFASWRALPFKFGEGGGVELSAGGVFAGSFSMVVLAGIIPLILGWRVNLAEFFGLRWEGWRHLFWLLPCFVVVFFFFNGVMYSLGWHEWVKENFGGRPQELVETAKNTQDVALLIAIAVGAVVFAPIAEEVIFRGYLYPVVKHFTEPWFAALFTGSLFGVIHFNVLGLPVLAVMGVVLVVLYERTGSIWVPIACHAAFNGATVFLLFMSRFVELPGTP